MTQSLKTSSFGSHKTEQLGQLLLDMGLINQEQLDRAKEVQTRDGKDVVDVLLEQKQVSPYDIVTALSVQLNVPFIDLKRHRIQPAALRLVHEETARKYNLVPMDIVGDSLVVVMENPTDIGAIEDVAVQSNKRIQASIGVPSEIQEAIDINYRASAQIEKHINEFTPSAEHGAASEPETSESVVAQAAIVRALDLIITQAVRDRASDIHIEPQNSNVRIRYRIDGVLRDTMSIPISTLTPLVSRLKILAGMDITEHRRPQDGQFSFQADDHWVDIRTATLETSYGETAVLRILDRDESLFNLGELGLREEAVNAYRSMLKSPFGIILVSGPTGSGKTTTLYASLNELDRVEQNIMTIEDPIEYKFADIKQTQVNEKAGVTFPSALRAMMRLDPDVILVGEIRDSETAMTAVQAALTGHLVLSSIHANDAASVAFRLRNLGVEEYLISSVIVGVVAQRMLRRVCAHCKTRKNPNEDEAQLFEDEFGEKKSPSIYTGVGCNFCSNTGYLERIGAFEILPFSSGIRRTLQEGSTPLDLRELAVSEGMVTLKRDGLLKVQQGITTPSEVMRNVFSIS